MNKQKISVAIIVPGLTTAGGVPSVADFLYNYLESTGNYRPVLISVPMSSKDGASIRIVDPKSWFSKPEISNGTWKGRPYQHAGAVLVEFEFQRYMPRKLLTLLLNQYDLIQVVAGSPAWAMLTKQVRNPVFLQVATLAKEERESSLRRLKGFRSFWLRAMTFVTTHIECFAIRHLYKIFVENSKMYEWASSKIGKERTILAPPGVNTDLFKPGQYKRDSYILAVGRFSDHRKNPEMLFRSYAKLKSIWPTPPPLVLAGKSMPDNKTMSLAYELDIIGQIHLKKNLSNSQLADLYRNACMFVLTSNEEGLGIVILEAMASGVPVISTKCGGPEFILSDGITGYLVRREDYIACSEKMKTLLENPELAQKMGKRGRNTVKEKFSIEAAGKIFLNAYDAVIRGE